MSSRLGTFERLAFGVGRALATLNARMAPASAAAYFKELGVNLPPPVFSGALATVLDGISTAAAPIRGTLTSMDAAAAAGNDGGITAAGVTLLGQIQSVLQAMDSLPAALAGVTPTLPPSDQPRFSTFAGNIKQRVLIDVLTRDLEIHHQSLAVAAVLLRIIEVTFDPGIPGNPLWPRFVSRSLHLETLARVASSPAEYLRTTFGLGNADFDPTDLLRRIGDALALIGVDSRVEVTGPNDARFVSSLVTIAPKRDVSPPGLAVVLDAEIPDQLDLSFQALPGMNVAVEGRGTFPFGSQAELLPPATLKLVPASGAPPSGRLLARLGFAPVPPDTALVLFGLTGGTRIEATGADVSAGVTFSEGGAGEPLVQVGLRAGAALLSFGSADGFLKEIAPPAARADLDLRVSWAPSTGVRFAGSGGLEVRIPLQQTVGPITIDAFQLAARLAQTGQVELDAAVAFRAALGPVIVTVEGTGVTAALTFPPSGGNLGVANVALSFLPPRGLGLSIEAGPVSGGGFVSLGDGRYSGVLALKIYSVSVSAFGIIDTRLPDGSEGFSFVIVISAEFTPIQLGFGFTLLGVGGMLGINRTVDEAGLRKALNDGSLENVLFPRNVTERAPEVIGALQAIFPPTAGRYLFGPMAKLGWGTPTLISADIGVVLELPGPLITILGELRCLLPSPESALVALNMGVTGRLDFPNKSLGVDATLRESSRVGPYRMSGQMAMRIRWGDRPLFALAVGGFHPGFQPPADFPGLAPLTADIGLNGNPSVLVTGFFAITSNTVQIGGALTLHASGSGIRLDAEVSVKALFVFSPFHFDAMISAGVRVSFRGRGIGVHLHGALSGPTPWRLRGEICVSILFWDACLGINKTFGGGQPVTLPAVDSWGVDQAPLIGLRAALQDTRNWLPLPPPRAFQVVSLADAPAGDETRRPIDPLGRPRVQERVLPLETKNSRMTRFGPAPTSGPERFTLSRATFGGTALPLKTDADVFDSFAPAQYFDLNEAQKLSAPSFDRYNAGYTMQVAPDASPVGSVGQVSAEFTTFVRDSRPGPAPDPTEPLADRFPLPLAHLPFLARRGASELFGVARTGADKFIPSGLRSLFTHREGLFQVTDRSTLAVEPLVGGATSQWEATLALADLVATNPGRAGRLQVSPAHELGGP